MSNQQRKLVKASSFGHQPPFRLKGHFSSFLLPSSAIFSSRKNTPLAALMLYSIYSCYRGGPSYSIIVASHRRPIAMAAYSHLVGGKKQMCGGSSEEAGSAGQIWRRCWHSIFQRKANEAPNQRFRWPPPQEAQPKPLVEQAYKFKTFIGPGTPIYGCHTGVSDDSEEKRGWNGNQVKQISNSHIEFWQH